MTSSKLIRLSGLFAKRAEDGSVYYTGDLGHGRLLVLPNKFKGGNEAAPDFNLWIAPHDKPTGGRG